MVILGIDPGLASTGAAAIADSGRGWRMLATRVVLTRPEMGMPERLEAIYLMVHGMIQEHRPSAVAIESVFFAKNVRSAVLMAHGRGAAILAASRSGVELREYSPLEVKQSVVGKGRATKGQVAQLVMRQLSMEAPPATDHESDALAIALCHAYRKVLKPAPEAPAARDAAYAARKELLAKALKRRR